MGEIYQNWRKEKYASQILTGYNLETLGEEDQTLLEKLVGLENGNISESAKLKMT